MTPYELGLVIDDFNARYKTEQEERISLVYLGAYLQRVQKMPRLNDLLGTQETEKEQTPETMLEEVKRLNEMFGGSTS